MSRFCVDEADCGAFASASEHPRVSSYLAAAGRFEALAARVDPSRWDRIAIGEWTVRELVGHMAGSLSSVIESLTLPAAEVEEPSPTAHGWFLKVLSTPDIDRIIEADGVHRGIALGVDPARQVSALASRVRSDLATADPGRMVATPAGPCALSEYLGTRTTELILHSIDLADACALDPDLPGESAMEVLLTLARLLAARGEVEESLRLLSGRSDRSRGLNALAPLITDGSQEE